MDSRLVQAPRIDLDVLVRLNEKEIRALDAEPSHYMNIPPAPEAA